jgi:hypothetical protein
MNGLEFKIFILKTAGVKCCVVAVKVGCPSDSMNFYGLNYFPHIYEFHVFPKLSEI